MCFISGIPYVAPEHLPHYVNLDRIIKEKKSKENNNGWKFGKIISKKKNSSTIRPSIIYSLFDVNECEKHE